MSNRNGNGSAGYLESVSIHTEQVADSREYSSIYKPVSADAVARGKKIWIDLDNSPHVPFFLPIIDELQK